ncbi:MAG: glycoside hydrolase/phage tail family protein, partial [Marinicaulis sp.]|nr:glycoside hydrolase/phage tail family protein [Marinicaulis sp.]
IPQLSFEIEKSLRDNDPGALENQLTAVSMIPGSGEFVYGTTGVTREIEEGVTVSENIHNNQGVTDFTASLDQLIDAAPNLGHVSLVAAWFGDSLNAGACTLRPGVETATKTTTPYEWKVGDVDRLGAHLISTLNGAPAYGGTPADRSVIEAITSLKAGGIKVMFHPFILMDVAGFPWRGRIGVGANDKTAAATSDIAGFFGTASASDFSIVTGEVVYSGPAEWSFLRMILHCAHLCQLAGGVDSFLLGSELIGVTTARASASTYPAISQMKSLAAEVRTVLGGATEISYGADWSEYFGHQPADGSGDVFFHLDGLWSDSNIDFIGIDNYMPLADWRDGFAHKDALAGSPSQYDLDYLKSNINGGEGYDWFYASQNDRDAQTRTTITDGAYSEPWVFRYKDIHNWWSNAHYNRPGGVRDVSPTSWVAQSKKIIFTEAGAPAVDKAANQPNVFVDPKSTESAVPHYSSGARDDLAQRRVIEAQASFWNDASNNPTSSIYSAPMVDVTRAYVYAWDARPFPDFPARSDIWGDVQNWEKGHWLNGRLGRAPLDLLVKALAGEVGFSAIDAARLEGVVTGYVVDRPMSPREMIDPLADVYQFDMVETSGVIRFQPRHSEPVLTIGSSDLGARREGAFTLNLSQESDLPVAFRLGFFDEQEEFAPAAVEARDPSANPSRESGAEIAAVIPAAEAEARARSILADAWVMRETLAFSLPPSAIELEPGDTIILNDLGSDRRYRITDIEDGAERRAELVRVSPGVYDAPVGPAIFLPPAGLPVLSAPLWELFELPLIRDGDDPALPWLASFADPWPGRVALYRNSNAGSPILSGVAPARAVMGRLVTALPSASSGRWDNRAVDVSLSFGTLSSRPNEDVFAGANAFAVLSDDGAWEVCQFKTAALQSGGTWRLSGLLRGQAGSEAQAFIGASVNARFVLMTPSVTQTAFPVDLRGLPFAWQAGPEKDIPDTENFTKRTLTMEARGLKPLSPVHLRASKEASDIRLSWIRRTRAGGDSWEGEIPISEALERYRVTVFNGAVELHEIETTTPDYLYSAADILADFGGGGPGASLTFSVAQISDAVGEGVEKKEDVEVL